MSGIVAGAIALTLMLGVSANADSRHRDETWRNDRGQDRRDARRNDDRDFLSGVVERVDRRRDVVLVRERRSGRTVAVEMERRRGSRVDDLRRGDSVTFAGDWSRRGVFEARRIERVDHNRGR
jgi:hypothetical protein